MNTPIQAYIRWAFAGFFKMAVYYIMFLFMEYLTANITLSYWSWVIVSPVTYHIWKYIERKDFWKHLQRLKKRGTL